MGAESADYESGGDHDDYDDHFDRDKPRPVCVSEWGLPPSNHWSVQLCQ